MPNPDKASEAGEKKGFADRVTLGMPMSKREVVDAFLAQFPESTEANVLAAFINLRNAPDDATVTFTRGSDRGRDSLSGEIKRLDGTRLTGRLLVGAINGQPLQMIG